MQTRPISMIKSALVRAGARPRRILSGLYKGLVFELDLRHQAQLYVGLWERETYPWINQALHRCSWAIDVGAGRGELCVRLLHSSSAGPIFAFEPQASEIQALRRNAALNNCERDRRLIVIDKFAGPLTDHGSVAIDELSIDRAARGFLKVDVDGAEMAVLEGAKDLLASGLVDILIETHSLALEHRCVEFLTARGYACTIIANAWWRAILPELRPIEHNRWLWAVKSEA